MKEYGWSRNVRQVDPYVPGEQPSDPNIIKLNTNENPYPPAPGVQKFLSSVDVTDLRKYPDPASSELVDAIADYHDVDPSQVFVGVGSDDVLSMAFLAFFNGSDPVLFPDVTYSFYNVWADVYRVPYTEIPLSDDFTIDPSDYLRKNGGIIIANPNAPTGMPLPLSSIETIISGNRDSVVIVDEAYVDFGGESALSLLDKYDNLLVIRTFSKSRSLAGSRIGYAIGCVDMIRCLNDIKYSVNSYTMDRITLGIGTAAIRDEAYFRECVDRIIATRERTTEELKKLGFAVLPSATNFVFARHGYIPAMVLFEYLRDQGIYVRHFGGKRVYNYLRISIGTESDMDKLISVLTDYIERERA